MPQRREFILNALKIAFGVTVGAHTPLWSILGGEARAATPSGSTAVPFGAAVRDDALAGDPEYLAAVLLRCQQVVGEGNLKWADTRPARGVYDFEKPDGLLALAASHDIQMRGHTLAWYGAMPDWTNEIASATEAELELGEHIQTVVGRYAGRIKSWDVINEAIADDPARGAELRPSMWLERLGEGYIEKALRFAAAADPSAQLVINEYDIEATTDRSRHRRDALLDLIRRLKDRDVPLHAVGLQGHLHGELEIDSEGVSAFVAEVKAMGLDVLVTEMDVIDDRLPARVDVRDALAAARVQDFLGAIYASARPTALITWGITDKYTWVPTWFKRPDGLPNRPLPLDAGYSPKPLLEVIEQFISA